MPRASSNTPAVREPAAPEVYIPEGMSEADVAALTQGATGLLGESDIILPRMKLLQGLSAEVSDGVGNPGQYANNMTGQAYGSAVNVAVIKVTPQQLYMVQGVGLQCRAQAEPGQRMHGTGDPGIWCDQCSLKQWQDSTPPVCSEAYQYLVLPVDDEGKPIEAYPAALTMMSTGLKEAKRWNTMLKMAGQLPPWVASYKLSAEQLRNDKGTFYVPHVARAAALPTDTQRICFDFAVQLQTKDYQVADEAATSARGSVDGQAYDDDDEDDGIPY